MKKSNKLLLGGFLTILVFITTIHLSLYANYKNNKFTTYTAEDDRTEGSLQPFPNILFVAVSNIPFATVQFGDAAQVEKTNKGDIRYVQKGDTLHITGSTEQNGFQRPVTFYLPSTATLYVDNSSLTFEAGKKGTESSPLIYLKKSKAVFSGAQWSFQLEHLRLVASDGSSVVFGENTQINQLDLRLSASSIVSTTSNIAQLSIATDSSSRISLPAKQLLKATIKATTE